MEDVVAPDLDVGVEVNARVRLDVEADHHHDDRLVPMIEVDWQYDGPGNGDGSGLGSEVRYRCPECSQVTTVRVVARSTLAPSIEAESRSGL